MINVEGPELLASMKEPNIDPEKELQAYMDNKSIKQRSRPWKQTPMFFARTQREQR